MRNYNEQETDGKISEYNSALFKMKRLDNIQNQLNVINGNLLAFNSDFGVYNYQLKLSLCDSLFQEVESKLTPKEKEDINNFIKALKQFYKQHPVHQLIKMKVYPYKEDVKLDKDIWPIIESWLFDYETRVRNLIDEHGMDTSYGADDDGL